MEIPPRMTIFLIMNRFLIEVLYLIAPVTIIQQQFQEFILIHARSLLVELLEQHFHVADTECGRAILQFGQHRQIPQLGTALDHNLTHHSKSRSWAGPNENRRFSSACGLGNINDNDNDIVRPPIEYLLVIVHELK